MSFTKQEQENSFFKRLKRVLVA